MTFRQPLTYNRPLGQANQAPPGFIQGRVGGPSGGKQFAGNGQWKAYDWTNPTLRNDAAYLLAAARSESDVWSNRLLDLLKAKDKQFGGAGQWKAYDYPNPVGWDVKSRAQPAIDLKTWTQSLDVGLIGKDKQFRGPGQWTSYDWPNPVGRVWRYVDANFVNDLLPIPLTNVVFRKIVEIRWLYTPNPVVQHDFYQNLLATTLKPISQTPFGQDDWPNPSVQARSLDLLAWVQGPIPGPGVVAAPFSQDDWPNPRGLVTPSWTFIVQGPIPSAPVVAAPFSQDDWPNPRGSAPPVLTFLDQVRINLIGKDKAFGTTLSNYDWPIPLGPMHPLELRTFLQNLQQGTLAPFVQAPFNFIGWQNPAGALFSIDLINVSHGFSMLDAIPPGVVVVPPTVTQPGGASGKRYRQPAWWGDEKRRKLEKKVEAVQKQIQKKREQVDLAPDLERMQRLIEQIQELQVRLMKLLEQIDELNKEFEMDEVLRIYLIYRSLH